MPPFKKSIIYHIKMKKSIITAFAVLFSYSISHAQLVVDAAGNVGIGETILLSSSLTVNAGTSLFQNPQSNIGIVASPKSSMDYMNIGIGRCN